MSITEEIRTWECTEDPGRDRCLHIKERSLKKANPADTCYQTSSSKCVKESKFISFDEQTLHPAFLKNNIKINQSFHN